MKRILALLGGLALGLAWTAILAAPAHASATGDCKTVTTHIGHRVDSGAHGNWAFDDFTRTVKICALPAKPEIKAAVAEQWLYSAEASDEGTFITTGPKSPGAGVPLSSGLKGNMKGGFTVASFAAPASFAGLKSTGTETNDKSSSEWIKWLWPDSKGGDNLTTWGWRYWMCNQAWSNTAKGNEGDITGMSKAPCFVEPTGKDLCDGHIAITLANGATSQYSVALYYVSGLDSTQYPHGTVAVKGGASVTVQATPKDGIVIVKWDRHKSKTFTWKPCPSATPSPQTPSPTSVAGLPVTGPPTGGIVAVGAGAVLVGVLVVVFLGRRRRAHFTAQ